MKQIYHADRDSEGSHGAYGVTVFRELIKSIKGVESVASCKAVGGFGAEWELTYHMQGVTLHYRSNGEGIVYVNLHGTTSKIAKAEAKISARVAQMSSGDLEKKV